VNPNTGTAEFSLRDLDGYYVTISALNASLTPPRADSQTFPHDRIGSFTTDAVEATRAFMSAVARKRTSSRSSRYVRLVPTDDMCITAKTAAIRRACDFVTS
jgi:hypothetical protein